MHPDVIVYIWCCVYILSCCNVWSHVSEEMYIYVSCIVYAIIERVHSVMGTFANNDVLRVWRWQLASSVGSE